MSFAWRLCSASFVTIWVSIGLELIQLLLNWRIKKIYVIFSDMCGQTPYHKSIVRHFFSFVSLEMSSFSIVILILIVNRFGGIVVFIVTIVVSVGSTAHWRDISRSGGRVPIAVIAVAISALFTTTAISRAMITSRAVGVISVAIYGSMSSCIIITVIIVWVIISSIITVRRLKQWDKWLTKSNPHLRRSPICGSFWLLVHYHWLFVSLLALNFIKFRVCLTFIYIIHSFSYPSTVTVVSHRMPVRPIDRPFGSTIGSMSVPMSVPKHNKSNVILMSKYIVIEWNLSRVRSLSLSLDPPII